MDERWIPAFAGMTVESAWGGVSAALLHYEEPVSLDVLGV